MVSLFKKKANKVETAEAIKTTSYLSLDEIKKHLDKVEYIILVAPSPDQFIEEAPIHFTIFLNTDKELPIGVKEAVLDKLFDELGLTSKPLHLLAQLMPVGFATTKQQTPLPMLLIQPQDIHSIPHTYMYVVDFLANSNDFKEVTKDSLTGWSYVYED